MTSPILQHDMSEQELATVHTQLTEIIGIVNMMGAEAEEPSNGQRRTPRKYRVLQAPVGDMDYVFVAPTSLGKYHSLVGLHSKLDLPLSAEHTKYAALIQHNEDSSYSLVKVFHKDVLQSIHDVIGATLSKSDAGS